jgi:hypothetical protein
VSGLGDDPCRRADDQYQHNRDEEGWKGDHWTKFRRNWGPAVVAGREFLRFGALRAAAVALI